MVPACRNVGICGINQACQQGDVVDVKGRIGTVAFRSQMNARVIWSDTGESSGYIPHADIVVKSKARDHSEQQISM